jgi:hypothetical protein
LQFLIANFHSALYTSAWVTVCAVLITFTNSGLPFCQQVAG